MARDESIAESTNSMRWCGCGCGRAAAAARALWRVCAAEAAGAALLVLLTCLACCGPAAAASPLYRAVASGLVVTVLVQSLDHISGAYMNPTVTLAAVLWRRESRGRGLALVAAQLGGATLGGAALHALQPRAAAMCATLPAAHLHLYKAVCIEAALGGCLALVNCAAWDARNRGLRDSWPLRIGLSVVALSLVGGELTGASMNPVRSFAPALWGGGFAHHWVYWVGPLSGSLVCTTLYMCAWRPREPHEPLELHEPHEPRETRELREPAKLQPVV